VGGVSGRLCRKQIVFLLGQKKPEVRCSEKHIPAIENVNEMLKKVNLFVEQDTTTNEVKLLKLVGEYISTSSSSGETKRVITFSPTVFNPPNKTVDPKLVSVMMPFNTKFDEVLKTIKEACSNVGLDCKRVDDIWNNSTIIQDIFELIFCSSIVIVDFSGKNSNVFYEAGIAHTLGKHVIPVTQNIDDILFDLRHHRAIVYLNNREGRGTLKDNLEQKLKILLKTD